MDGSCNYKYSDNGVNSNNSDNNKDNTSDNVIHSYPV